MGGVVRAGTRVVRNGRRRMREGHDRTVKQAHECKQAGQRQTQTPACAPQRVHDGKLCPRRHVRQLHGQNLIFDDLHMFRRRFPFADRRGNHLAAQDRPHGIDA
jgi:hypothetical protein